MKLLAIDTETTGLNNRNPENMLQISMVFEDTQKTKDVPVESLPHFTALIEKDLYVGEPFALALNAWIFNEICNADKKTSKGYQVLSLELMTQKAINWMKSNGISGKDTYALGQNFSAFDLQFLPKEISSNFHFRHIELSSYFMDANAKGPAGLGQIKRQLGFDRTVHHDAYYEAMDYILCMRVRYGGNLQPYKVK